MNTRNGWYEEYPDTDINKDVTIYIDTANQVLRDRHCYIGWLNGRNEDGALIYQQIHLSGGGGADSSYAIKIPWAAAISPNSVQFKDKCSLGELTRSQRRRMQELAIYLRRQMEAEQLDNQCQALFTELGGEGVLALHHTNYNCQDWLTLYLRILQINDFNIPNAAFTLIETGNPRLRFRQ